MRAIQVLTVTVGLAACRSSGLADGPDEWLGESATETDTASEGDTASESDTASETDTASDTASETDTGDDPPPQCNPAAFRYAPAPFEREGQLLVPIDVLELDGDFEFRATQAVTRAEATLVFQLGETGGMPILDLRQNPTAIELDGEPLELGLFASTPLGPDDSTMRVLQRELEPCSVHTLTFAYWLGLPNAPDAGGLTYLEDPAQVHFDFFFDDWQPGRYLESWLPANMPWDRHPLRLVVRVVDTDTEHTLITTGEVETFGPQDWYVEFPDTTNSMSPMLLVKPSEGLMSASGVHTTLDGQEIPWEAHVYESIGVSLDMIEIVLGNKFDELAYLGAFPYAKQLLYIWLLDFGMEYRGGSTASLASVEHELFHAWWGRGVEPATYADGWFDEAWNFYRTEPWPPGPPQPDEGPWQLYDPHPFARITPFDSYIVGPRVFAGLEAILGEDSLNALMRELFEQGVPRYLSTAELEQHLYCAGGELPEIRQLFHRFVYGLEGEAAPAPADACG